ncbi:hypothetical protein SERLA73DRAFT_160536 [Serpula lacrymans var. lacrymans S7.3]|uniref:NAD(P)-binding domain-containing protein n=2 Tax=Serpula lacrymans var. lacrymans TaxID=341189 RepID=F8PYG2_SERL3|nr:uncharacterized protein SERLADRAFT_415596 [Serpula lacrymans var. lacrymans S7.9]EGN98925.1 hypothetical protein SERLA73DRAFT_160536 [Serpula lacrymans var. lacrymans S7.3]EGO24513.1 hypothetical protein SERLADRAFT_415596 [Serpula lacrymans var. lacrymans S7.9]
MSATTNVLITGATGYVGGAVLELLLEHPTASSSQFTALVRSPEKAQKLEAIGVHAVVGSLSELSKLEQLASESAVIFACHCFFGFNRIFQADSDDESVTKAILAGLKKRYESTGQAPILIHTSGTGVLTDKAAGMYAYDTIYDDTDVEQLETLADTQLHRNVDLLIIEADKQGYARTHIVLPSTIYARATGRFVQLGIQNPKSMQIPCLIRSSLKRGQGGMIGDGQNQWANVHIDDIASLYIVLYEAILANEAGHGREGLYFGENGEHLLYDVGKAVAEALYDLGKGRSPEPTTVTEEKLKADLFAVYLGSNSRCRASRARALGWEPKYTTKDLLASIKPEVEAMLKE